MITSVTEQVQAGADLLDKHGPADWRSRVDLSRLDILDPDNCILGQIYGDYNQGMKSLGIVTGTAYGFISAIADKSMNEKKWKIIVSGPSTPLDVFRAAVAAARAAGLDVEVKVKQTVVTETTL